MPMFGKNTGRKSANNPSRRARPTPLACFACWDFERYGLFTTFAPEHSVSEPMVPRTAKSLRAVVAGVAALVLSFSLLRPAAELFAILIRRHWPEAWFSGLIVWYLDFIAAALAIAIAIAIGRYSFRMEHQAESKPDRVDRLLSDCA